MGKGAEAANGKATVKGQNGRAQEMSNDVGDSAFARALASSDYHTRAKGWKALQIWLQTRQQLKLAEVLKIWRGILFCFWHSDKSHVQEELATQLAQIMLMLPFDVCCYLFPCLMSILHAQHASAQHQFHYSANLHISTGLLGQEVT
jgi:hypothetical protein